MPTILNNVTAMQASRQIGVTQMGLKTAIERLTTGKRINRASDDAAGMVAGTNAEAAARSAKESVRNFQTAFFNAQASDANLEEATNQALRLAELEGSGNASATAGSEYVAVKGLVSAAAIAALGTGVAAAVGTALNGLTASGGALSYITGQRATFAATMATAQSSATRAGIAAEGGFAVSDSINGADIGAEMVNLTKFQILMQAGTSALSNANQSSQTVLGLFR